MQKKGQAAMEFLMTYGWAILAAIIAIGVLAYFGVFSPGKYLPGGCIINQPLGCEEHTIGTSGVRLIIRNGAGDQVNMTSIKVGDCTEITDAGLVNDGSTKDVTLTGCTGLTLGSKFRGDITIKYLKSGAIIEQSSTGSVSGKVV